MRCSQDLRKRVIAFGCSGGSKTEAARRFQVSRASATTQTLITSTGASLLFLPPYSPDLNPIEHDFAALKKLREYNEQHSLDHLINTYKSVANIQYDSPTLQVRWPERSIPSQRGTDLPRAIGHRLG